MTYYLYQKTHLNTNLQYLGFTRKNPEKYKGSGVYWLSHLKKHGNNVATKILLETNDYDELCQAGKYYSELWNVVNSALWANLKPEYGEGGGVPGMNKNKTRPSEHKEAMRRGWQRIKKEGYQPWNKGKVGIYRSGKPVIIVSPEGKEYRYDRLKDGCQELGLTYSHMSSVNTGKKSNWKGWTIKSLNTG
jgi:hypothetical protein